jgi:hypothetical protein
MAWHCHPSAKRIEPNYQGRLDSLCGLYALINAARLIYADTAPLTGQSCKRLFADGMDFLTAKKGSRDAAHWGMTVGRQRKLAKYVLASTVLEGRPKLRHGPTLPPISDLNHLQSTIDTAITGGDVLLACFHGRISHHTIIVGQTPTRVLLFDSDGMKYVNKASLTFCKGHGGTLVLHAAAQFGLR